MDSILIFFFNVSYIKLLVAVWVNFTLFVPNTTPVNGFLLGDQKKGHEIS